MYVCKFIYIYIYIYVYIYVYIYIYIIYSGHRDGFCLATMAGACEGSSRGGLYPTLSSPYNALRPHLLRLVGPRTML